MTIDVSVLEENGIEFTSMSVDENPYMSDEGSDLRHFICSLSGGTVDFDFYVSLGVDLDMESPSAEFALKLVYADMSAFKQCKGYPEFADLLGYQEADASAAVSYEELRRLEPHLEKLSGLVPEAGISMNL